MLQVFLAGKWGWCLPLGAVWGLKILINVRSSAPVLQEAASQWFYPENLDVQVSSRVFLLFEWDNFSPCIGKKADKSEPDLLGLRMGQPWCKGLFLLWLRSRKDQARPGKCFLTLCPVPESCACYLTIWVLHIMTLRSLFSLSEMPRKTFLISWKSDEYSVFREHSR